MKRTSAFLLLIITLNLISAQDAFHNFGDVKIHGNLAVGFHLDLINDGDFDQSMGLVGFYSQNSKLKISGNNVPDLYDVEFHSDQGIMLQSELKVKNNANIISGNIYTAKKEANAQLNFTNDAFYIGETDVSKVDGYAAMMNKDNFTFPVGNQNRLRPLTIESVAINSLSKSAYFDEDPNNSNILGKDYSTSKTQTEYLAVSNMEFWRLESAIPSKVTLSWDELSNVSALGDYLSDLKVVGWDKAAQQWVNLGNTGVEGNIYYGKVTSDFFIPDQYEIITLGGNNDLLQVFETIKLDNYYLTPNADGTNDYLEIEGIDQSSRNAIQIFNRYGQLVYSKENYNGEFNGTSNVNNVLDRPKGLESGIYFYICTFHDLQQKHQGYLYLTN